MKGSDRLVCRIHRRWRANGSACRPGLTPREHAELQARIDRLRAMGDCFTHVRLSDDVMQACMTGVRTRSKGAFVATEA
jgi:hypothetical protein